MQKVICFVCVLITLSCNNPENSEQQNKTVAPSNDQVEQTMSFKVLESSDFELSKLSYDGEIKNKSIWQDQNGENIVLFTGQEDLEKGAADIFVYHYVVNGGEVRLLKEVKESVEDCADADLFLNFKDRAGHITDLDKDNYGEITFAYQKACVTDVSPHDLTLHLFENGDDYQLIGNTEVHVGGGQNIGGQIAEERFKDAPVSFVSYANKLWEDIKKD